MNIGNGFAAIDDARLFYVGYCYVSSNLFFSSINILIGMRIVYRDLKVEDIGFPSTSPLICPAITHDTHPPAIPYSHSPA
jgi:hypothetical protein